MTKGIIKGKVTGTGKYAVRIPYLESAGSGQVVLEATLCTNPSMRECYKEGDVVFVAFEDGEYGKPVILGALSLGGSDGEPRGYLSVESLSVASRADLPQSTSVDSFELPNLQAALESLSDGLGAVGDGAVAAGDSVIVDCDGSDSVA